MIERIISFFRHAFDPETEQVELDRYLESKNITTAAELEYWMKEYDLRKRVYSRLVSEGKLNAAKWSMTL